MCREVSLFPTWFLRGRRVRVYRPDSRRGQGRYEYSLPVCRNRTQSCQQNGDRMLLFQVPVLPRLRSGRTFDNTR